MDISDADTSLAARTENRPTSNSMGTPEMESSLAVIISKLSELDSIEAKLDHLEYIENEVGYVRKELDEYQRSQQFTQSQLADACEAIDELKCKVQTSDDQTSKLSSKLKMLETENKKLHERVVQQEAYSRRENIIIDGMTETENENCEVRVQEMFGFMDVGSFALQRCHWIGRRTDKNRPRAIIVRFSKFGDKVKVMSQGAKLKGTGLYIKDDFPTEWATKRASLRPVLKVAKEHDESAALIQDKLRFKGTLCTTQTAQSIQNQRMSFSILFAC